MDVFLRFSLCFSLLVGGALGIGYSQPQWLADLGLDFWQLSELNLRINQAGERGEDLDQQITSMLEQSQYKTRIVEDLISGKIPLAEAAVLIQEVTSQELMEMILGPLEVKETSLNGRAARMLIYWVGQELKRHPQQKKAVCARLEKELKQTASLWN